MVTGIMPVMVTFLAKEIREELNCQDFGADAVSEEALSGHWFVRRPMAGFFLPIQRSRLKDTANPSQQRDLLGVLDALAVFGDLSGNWTTHTTVRTPKQQPRSSRRTRL